MDSISFSLDLGLSTVRGVLRLEDAGLVVEWRRFNLFDSPMGDLETVTMPYRDLSEIEYRKRLFGAILTIRAHRSSVFSGIPMPNEDILCLRPRIAHAERSRAEIWAAEAALRVIEADEQTGKLIE